MKYPFTYLHKGYPNAHSFSGFFTKNLSFHLFPLGKAELSGVFEKIIYFVKTPSLIWTKGAEMHTHFCGFPRKNFYSVKRPPHLFGITKSNDTLFLRKTEKIFFQLRDGLLLLAPKVPSLIWNGKVKTQPVF